MWVLGIEHRSSDLVAGFFTFWATSAAYKLLYIKLIFKFLYTHNLFVYLPKKLVSSFMQPSIYIRHSQVVYDGAVRPGWWWYHVVQAGYKLTLELRLAWNFRTSCPTSWLAGITGMQHHTSLGSCTSKTSTKYLERHTVFLLEEEVLLNTTANFPKKPNIISRAFQATRVWCLGFKRLARQQNSML